MARWLRVCGFLLAGGGTAAGVAFLIVRRLAFARAMLERRDWLAPLKWDLSLWAGLLLILGSVVFGAILIGFGKVFARLEALERPQRSSGAPADGR
ncbi:MAG: hypothetical protein ACRENJ_00140 [Candidatus Eiseniibacteriota bacterium]